MMQRLAQQRPYFDPRGGYSSRDTFSRANPLGVARAPASFRSNDQRIAEHIDRILRAKRSPATRLGPASAGQMMVDAGRRYRVNPFVLLSIAGHETGFGRLGVGARKMLGVSAYNHNPGNRNPRYDGVRNQIYEGARLFARLRAKGGSSANSTIGHQLQAANRGGWATTGSWWGHVANMYRKIVSSWSSLA
jgi:hypothetical protein